MSFAAGVALMEILLPGSKEFVSTLDVLLFIASDNPNYSALGVEYYKEYYRDIDFVDLSFIVTDNKVPILAFIGSSRKVSADSIEIAAYGQPCFHVECNQHSTSMKSARKILKKKIKEFVSETESVQINYRDSLQENSLSVVSQYLLDQGAFARPLFDQVVNLTKPVIQLRQDVRKSYKSLINWGLNNLTIKILNASNVLIPEMNDFRNLHINVAGRETRSEETWNIQYQMIQKGKAFLVLGYLDDVLVTGAFFIFNEKSCYYGVAASNRALFDKPISHAIIWSAITYAREQGQLLLIMGQQLFLSVEEPKPTVKELGISTFKKGFGGETKVSMEIQLGMTREQQRQ